MNFSGPLQQKAHELAHVVYDITGQGFPMNERFGLLSQIRRAVISVPSNIIEGYSRNRSAVYINHLEIAYGSLMEVKYQLYFSCQRGYIEKEEYKKAWILLEEVAKMLWSSIQTLNKKKKQ